MLCRFCGSSLSPKIQTETADGKGNERQCLDAHPCCATREAASSLQDRSAGKLEGLAYLRPRFERLQLGAGVVCVGKVFRFSAGTLQMKRPAGPETPRRRGNRKSRKKAEEGGSTRRKGLHGRRNVRQFFKRRALRDVFNVPVTRRSPRSRSASSNSKKLSLP
jgi:hypothetical protein